MSAQQPNGPIRSTAFELPKGDAFKYQWSRHVAREQLKNGVEKALETIPGVDPLPDATVDKNLGTAMHKAMSKNSIGDVPSENGHFKVGIVGAGAAGLFTALALDWINDTIESYEHGKGKLKVDYEILEASSKERSGGRLYTHRFSEDGLHDYYDVGAMRFPENSVMDRTFRLFNYLGIKKGSLGNRKEVTDQPVLVPYYLRDDNNLCPAFFNNTGIIGDAWTGKIDPFSLNEGIEGSRRIPDDITKTNPSDLIEEALRPFVDLVKECFRQKKDDEDDEPVWAVLRKGDQMSVRQYLLSSDKNPKEKKCDSEDCKTVCCHDPFIPGRNFSYNTIQWLETATYGTGWYDQSLTEAALETIDFQVPAKDAADTNKHWWCVDGGAQSIAKTMYQKIKNQAAITYNTQVVGMNANIERDSKGNVIFKAGMELDLKDPVNRNPLGSKEYFVVFNSATLGATNRMDLSKAGLLWDTKQAIRCLNYGASCKVGIKFKTAWWRKAPFNITQGGVARTDLSLQVCVYPSYNIDDNLDPVDQPAVLLVSYTWGQTAQRLAALIASKSRNEPKAAQDKKRTSESLENEVLQEEEAELREILLRDLAYLHAEKMKLPNDSKEKAFNDTHDLIQKEYLEHHAYDWYHDPHMAGAFAYFGPGQFSELYPAITKPNALGRLYFVGEAASAHHAWVVGALESVVRALWLMFNNLHQATLDKGGVYEPYEWAMQLLERGYFEIDGKEVDGQDGVYETHYFPSQNPNPSPFFPLPVEMPVRTDTEARKRGRKDNKLSDHLDLDNLDGLRFMFGAAFVGLSLVEFFVQYIMDSNDFPGQEDNEIEA